MKKPTKVKTSNASSVSSKFRTTYHSLFVLTTVMFFLSSFWKGSGEGALAQSIGINITGNPADPKSLLDIDVTGMNPKGGLLIPRMTTAERNAITAPIPESLLLFNTTTKCFETYVNGLWNSLWCPSVCTIPATPGTITGAITACNGSAGNVYSISAVSGATSYTWTVPSGASITSGQGTASIIVAFGSASGNIGVTATNACGTSAANTLVVTINPPAPATPGAITGSTTFCSGSAGNVYSVSAVSGATSYTWSVPSGATIASGQGTVSITVTFGSTSGNISVTATNSCGTSAANTLAVTLVVSPTGSAQFIIPGTYSWNVPVGVTSVSVVCIGGGGGGGQAGGDCGGAGGGGALAYKNNIAVTPGANMTVVVGAGGSGGIYGGGEFSPTSGGNSTFSTVTGGGGYRGFVYYNPTTPNVGQGGTPSGHDGGSAGKTVETTYGSGKGGGGAGGYDASSGGGNGGWASDGGTGYPGGGAGGGGVGLLGIGAGGANGATNQNGNNGGGGGSGGITGANKSKDSNPAGNGGDYGGGGGGGGYPGTNVPSPYNNGGNGGVGAVRIIWGCGKSFPSNAN